MPKKSAGILLFRRSASALELMLVHPGGPFWQNKDTHAWSIPKGEFETEEPVEAAKRELLEETGIECSADLLDLGQLKQPSGKVVYAWAVEQDWDPSSLRSNSFELEWPPKSGKLRTFPEVDRAAWFTVEEARHKIHKGQAEFVERLVAMVKRAEP